MTRKSPSEMTLYLQGYRLTTAEIVYFLPDHPDLLQVFIWQNLDRAPDFPRLHEFLLFWNQNIDARIFSVRVGQAKRGETRFADIEFTY